MRESSSASRPASVECAANAALCGTSDGTRWCGSCVGRLPEQVWSRHCSHRERRELHSRGEGWSRATQPRPSLDSRKATTSSALPSNCTSALDTGNGAPSVECAANAALCGTSDGTRWCGSCVGRLPEQVWSRHCSHRERRELHSRREGWSRATQPRPSLDSRSATTSSALPSNCTSALDTGNGAPSVECAANAALCGTSDGTRWCGSCVGRLPEQVWSRHCSHRERRELHSRGEGWSRATQPRPSLDSRKATTSSALPSNCTSARSPRP